MKFIQFVFFLIVLAAVLVTCKTVEQPVANYYKPVFDQTKNKLMPVGRPNQADLDTTVLIRSNIRETVVEFFDTIIISETFYIESGELAVPIELINAKPPKYDTFLVAQKYLVNTELVDVLFPVIPDSLAGVIDSLNLNYNDSITVPRKNTDYLAFAADSFSNNSFNDSINAHVVAEFFEVDDILADEQRDLFQADSVLQAIFSDAPWQIGDSIPYFKGMENTFLDSMLLLVYDTVHVRIFDPADIIPQLPFDVLSDIKIDTIDIVDSIIYHREVVFKIFYPNEIDLFIDMVRVTGGTFKIGNDYYDEDERPAYKIRLSNFLISKHEVTNYLFTIFLNDLKCDSLGEFEGIKIIDLDHPMTRIDRNKFTGRFSVEYGYDNYPVVNVSWAGAQMFCKASGGRLPSEAEWEYAARGGIYAKRKVVGQMDDDYEYLYLYAGAYYMSDVGWFVDNSHGDVWAVGRKIPNELGLFDMCGNVWEWCYDKYNNQFYRINDRSLDPMCLTGPNVRVNRGGSWSNDAIYCRVTNRNFLGEFNYNPYIGFRYMREWR
jgi:formylglycine-generating enzyme required for sulfatase activity